METLAELPRVWAGTYLSGYHDWGDAFALAPTYAGSHWIGFRPSNASYRLR